MFDRSAFNDQFLPRKPNPGTKGLGPAECRLEQPTGAAGEAAEAIEKAGGCVVGSSEIYTSPLIFKVVQP
jgi:hypothetical protein